MRQLQGSNEIISRRLDSSRKPNGKHLEMQERGFSVRDVSTSLRDGRVPRHSWIKAPSSRKLSIRIRKKAAPVDWHSVNDFFTSSLLKTQDDEMLRQFTHNLFGFWSFLSHSTTALSDSSHHPHQLTAFSYNVHEDTYDYDALLQSFLSSLETMPTSDANPTTQEITRHPSFQSVYNSAAKILSIAKERLETNAWSAADLSGENVRAWIAGNLLPSIAQNDTSWKSFGFLLSLISGLVVLGNTSAGFQGRSSNEEPADEIELQRLTSTYNPEEMEIYWSQRWQEVAIRQNEIATKLMSFLAKVYIDAQLNQLDRTLTERAKELRMIVQELGPAFIKVFQALATRGDVIPEACTKEFTLLQDQVEVFPTELALQEIESSLGVPWRSAFQWISKQPLAAASLGQVYHGLLDEEYGGKEVAVKVQRPNIFRSACLDVFILRRLVHVLTFVPNMSEEWKHLLDGWAVGFFDELNYVKEAHHMILFKKNLKDLKDVKIPRVFVEFSSRTVLTTEWIFGEKFTEARLTDPRSSCRVLLNCYLNQLLEIGYLHADPHPGNLISTNDGKLCLLDFGLVAQVTEDQKYALVEFITHLWTEDWDAIALDLEHLGFLPENTNLEENPELKSVLEKIFLDMVHGDGLRVNKITHELDLAARQHQIVIPSYFTLILRAFCIVEGLCIELTGGFSIVQECAPYIARRLLQDDNERLHGLLRSVLYSENDRLDLHRVQRLLHAAGDFTLSDSSETTSPARGVSLPSEVGTRKVLDQTLTEAIRIVLSSRSSLAQKLLINELVSIVDGATIEGLLEAFRLVLGTILSKLLLTDQDRLKPPEKDPVYGVLMMMSAEEPRLRVTDTDRETLRNLKTTLDAMTSTTISRGTIETFLSIAKELSPLLPELLPGFLFLVTLFVKELTRRKAQKLADLLQS